MKAKYGYIGMTADFLHIGHLKAINECKKHCTNLIVGIMTDKSVLQYKHKKPFMNQNERRFVVDQIKLIYKTIFQDSFEFPHTILRLKDFYGKDFIIFDSEEHCREYSDILIKRTPNISSSYYKRENENLNTCQL